MFKRITIPPCVTRQVSMCPWRHKSFTLFDFLFSLCARRCPGRSFLVPQFGERCPGSANFHGLAKVSQPTVRSLFGRDSHRSIYCRLSPTKYLYMKKYSSRSLAASLDIRKRPPINKITEIFILNYCTVMFGFEYFMRPNRLNVINVAFRLYAHAKCL